MLNDIQKAEQEAQDVVAKAHADADERVRTARDEAAHIIEDAEREVRTLTTSSINEGKETGQREAEKIIAEAEGEIKAQEQAVDALVAKAADAVMNKVNDIL